MTCRSCRVRFALFVVFLEYFLSTNASGGGSQADIVERQKRSFFYADLKYCDFPQEDFFGLGPDSNKADRTDYYKYPNYPEVGRIESTHFSPPKWRPEYPNSAFDRMQNEDSLWATGIIMKFADDVVRAVVHTGNILDSEAENIWPTL